jgi:hypothetical protein
MAAAHSGFSAGHLNRARVPGWSLLLQGIWAGLLVLLITYSL